MKTHDKQGNSRQIHYLGQFLSTQRRKREGYGYVVQLQRSI